MQLAKPIYSDDVEAAVKYQTTLRKTTTKHRIQISKAVKYQITLSKNPMKYQMPNVNLQIYSSGDRETI